MTSTNVTCNNDGSATATPASGIYDFVWSNGTTDLAVSSSTITSLPAGTFCVTVTDTVTGCVDSGCVFVAPNANVPIVFVNNVSAVTCAGASDGTVTIGTSNGVAPFTYVWDTIVPGIPGAPISVNYTVSGLPPRDYTVTSTDAVGCVSVITFNVPTPDSLTIVVIDTINPLCPSSSDGRIEVEGLGGTGLITYVWSNGIAADSGILAGIDTGLYCVTVVDENNCSNSICFNLNAQQVLTTSPVISTPITCNNGSCNS